MIAELLGSGIFGTLAGIIGGAITAITNYKMQKLKNEHDLAMLKAETEAMIAEAKANIAVTKAKVEGEVEIAETKALTASYESLKHDAFKEGYMKYLAESKWTKWWAPPLVGIMFALVDFLKKAARPVLTYYLVGACTWLTILVWRIVNKSGVAIEPSFAQEILNQLIVTVTFLTVSCVTWWFCDRRTAKFLMRLNDGNIKESRPDIMI